MSKKLLFKLLTGMCVMVLLFTSCSYKLSLTGASIPADLKTVDVQFFENNAQLVVPTLSQNFTEALKARIRNTTDIKIVRGDADAVFSGAVTGYSIAPISIEATTGGQRPIAGASRLTITVAVKYVKYIYKDGKRTSDPDKILSFDETFTRFANYSGDIASQEQGLIADINKQLTEDIFNRAFANW
ncbi:hypothetical protein FPZ42_03705 [Mucilaginibacter achroorhodeus]|uniref:Lipopolysaccharide assembly protein n=1 Tax=Mucilaginibacter achroorhodeus TaxID=2599294 RepID=A0A563UAG4_9SPHI|nr:LptE family protein [Mucilaginibacter achroorhodeus]TWR28330.1 hypothetical protein FPZ42_03705 [Mucilaginibacter achroorhodeus]